MKTIIFGLFLFLPWIARALSTDIVITEIGAYKAADHEWIEIYNRGSTPADLTGWKFFEDETNHKLTAYRGDLVISPTEFVIIADQASNFEIDYPEFKGTIIDSSWTILKESGEPIALKDANGTIIESFTYISAPNGSLERVDFNLPDYSQGNWKENASGDTAGFPNSSTLPPDFNQVPPGVTTSSNSLTQETNIPRPQAVPVPAYGPGSVVINEFVSDPGDDAVEWVEILNKSEAVINLNNWILEDANYKIAQLAGELLPQDVRVFELTSSRLNNNGDQIKLFDAKGALIDSVSYGSFDDGEIANNAPKARYPNSVARGNSGLDTDEDDKNFFIVSAPTPGSPNNIAMMAEQDEEVIEEEAVASPKIAESKNETSTGLNKDIDKKIGITEGNQSRGFVEIQGTVSVPPGVLGNQIFYIETSFGGREIYMFRKDFPKIAHGDTVWIQGIESEATAGKRIKVKTKEDIIILDQTKTFPRAREFLVEDLTKDEVASLVKISGEIIESKGKNKFILADDTGELLIYIKPGAGSANFVYALGDTVTVIGILGQVSGAWRLLPRAPSDIINNSRVVQNPELLTRREPVALGENRTLGIVFGSLGVSGIGALFLGIKFKDRILPRRKKRPAPEEIIDLDKYE